MPMMPASDRRAVLTGASAVALMTLVPRPAHATAQTMSEAMQKVLGGITPKAGRIKLDITPLAENGNAVPVTITVDSPMTLADHVKEIHLFSPENPGPDIARFHLGPRAGRARVQTSIRLATTQRIEAIAVMSDGSIWRDSAEIIVTLSACLDAG